MSNVFGEVKNKDKFIIHLQQGNQFNKFFNRVLSADNLIYITTQHFLRQQGFWG